MSDAADLLRRHLRQRAEFGESDLILDGLTRADLISAIGRQSTGRRGGDGQPEAPPPGVARMSPPVQDPPVASAGADAAALDIVRIGGLSELRETVLQCQRCGLAGSRRNVVFGEGNEHADLVVVGEAPGSEEDRSGRPFVGRAGQLLNRLLLSAGFPRESVYICNVLKCRPPANRNPEPGEIAACSPYLHRQVELVAPKVILTVGTFAAQTLLESRAPINQLRGTIHRWRGTPLISTYHPAALLRNPAWIRPTWEDLQRLRAVLDGEEPVS